MWGWGRGAGKWYIGSFLFLKDFLWFPFNYPCYAGLLSPGFVKLKMRPERHTQPPFAVTELAPWGDAPLNLRPSSEFITARNLRRSLVLRRFSHFPRVSETYIPPKVGDST